MTTFFARLTGSGAGPAATGGAAATTGAAAAPGRAARPLGQWAYTGVAVTSFGGPLALAALLALSYLLYIVYTTAQVVYDTLPAVLPGERRYQALLKVVAPLAADPTLLRAQIPGMAVAQRFAGHGFAVTVGIGVAVSVAGVILVEYLALSRLTTAVTAWPLRRVVIGIGIVMVATAPLLLFNPQAIYDDLLTPSLFALWLSELVTFAVYPRFVARRGGRLLPAVVLAAAASALAVYGLWTTIQTTSI